MVFRMCFLFLVCLISTETISQKTYDIKGIVIDKDDEPLLGSTIMLLDMDSTFVDFSRAELDGSFEFKNVAVGNYLVKVTFVGFIPVTIEVSSKGENIDLSKIVLNEIATELMEVVIKAAKAPIKMRGDTIEYDATTFKVPEGSSVEDLLKRLPGIQVDQNGDITADGQNVSQVTVDGKKFFGGDPKAATKNLQAEGISKVQVFDTKTETEEITGVNDNTNQDKTLNLELKDDYKSGAFGKVTAGIGNIDRKELKGNYNRFNDKIQFSLIGVANNTGRNGLSWDDYQGFLGSQAWSFGNEGVYGFGSGGGMRIISFGSEDDGLESSLQDIFFSDGQAGFPTNYNGGTNINFEDKKTKLNGYYFVSQKGLDATRLSTRETFLENGNVLEESEAITETTALGHRGEVSWEQEIDSFHTLIIKTQAAAVDNQGLFFGNSASRFQEEEYATNVNEYDNENNTTGHLINTRVLLRKKFKSNKKRRMGLNAAYQYSSINEFQLQNSTNDFFDNAVLTAREVLDQNYDNVASKNLFSANALFVEPLSNKISIQTFYNFSNRQEIGNRQVVDIEDNSEMLNSFLTRDYENDIRLNRLGSSINYSNEGFNLSIGAAYQHFSLEGIYEGVAGSGINGVVDKVYTNWIPNMSINFSPIRNSYFNLSYNVSAQEPTIRNLQPIIDNSNPLYLREGNPELEPEITHSINTYFSFSRPLSGFRVYMNGGYSFFNNQIITEQTINENLVTYVRPINFDGGNRSNISTGLNFPIKQNKLTMGFGFSGSISNTNSFVNAVLNKTNTFNYSPNTRLSFTPGDKFAFYVNARFGFSDTQYNVNSRLNQKTQNFNYGAELNTELLLGFKLNSEFTLSSFKNDRLDLDQDVPILNVSIYKQFLKGNKGEFRLSLYDAFNKNVSINQFSSNYFITRSNTATLARYAMLSFTYNIQGLKSGIKKD
jgi:hypothetical protein